MRLDNEYGDVSRLSDHQRQLHRAQMAAERRRRALERETGSPPATEEEAELLAERARWPGLVDQQFPNDPEEQ